MRWLLYDVKFVQPFRYNPDFRQRNGLEDFSRPQSGPGVSESCKNCVPPSAAFHVKWVAILHRLRPTHLPGARLGPRPAAEPRLYEVGEGPH